MAVGLPAQCSVEETKRKIQLDSAGMREVVWGKETLGGDGEQATGERARLIPVAANSFWVAERAAPLRISPDLIPHLPEGCCGDTAAPSEGRARCRGVDGQTDRSW